MIIFIYFFLSKQRNNHREKKGRDRLAAWNTRSWIPSFVLARFPGGDFQTSTGIHAVERVERIELKVLTVLRQEDGGHLKTVPSGQVHRRCRNVRSLTTHQSRTRKTIFKTSRGSRQATGGGGVICRVVLILRPPQLHAMPGQARRWGQKTQRTARR